MKTDPYENLDPLFKMDHYDLLEEYDKLPPGAQENIDWYANRYYEKVQSDPFDDGFLKLDEEEQKQILWDCVLRAYVFARKRGQDPHAAVLSIMR